MKSNQKDKVIDYSAKIIIVGDSGVGKTALLLRFCKNQFSSTLTSTIGVDFRNKNMDVSGKSLKLQLWDTAGQQRFKNVNQTYFKGAQGVILVYSISDKQSFQSIQSWIQQINENSDKKIIKFLVATKLDLQQSRQVSFQTGRIMANKHKMQFFQVSSKSNANVANVFQSLSSMIMQKLSKKQNKEGQNKQNTRISLSTNTNKEHPKCKC